MKRGEIYLADLNPVVGSEISKTRPVLIVSNDINNEFSEVVTILPITSKTSKIYPFEIILLKDEANIHDDSKIKANQIRSIDKQRLVKKLGKIDKNKMTEVEKAIILHLDIHL